MPPTSSSHCALITHTCGDLDGIRRQASDQKMKVNSSADLSVLLAQNPHSFTKRDFVPATQAADEGKEHGQANAFRQFDTLEGQSAEELPVNALQRVCKCRFHYAPTLVMAPDIQMRPEKFWGHIPDIQFDLFVHDCRTVLAQFFRCHFIVE